MNAASGIHRVRIALDYLQRRFPSEHPLATQEFESDGLDLFVEKYGQLINISQAGHLAMREILEAYLRRIERDPLGFYAGFIHLPGKGSRTSPGSSSSTPTFHSAGLF